MLLCNFSNTDYHLDFFKDRWYGLENFIKEEGLDGIELLLHGNDDISQVPRGLVKGLHLSYYPTWLEFYKNDETYKVDYPTLEDLEMTFGGSHPDAIVDRFKRDFEVAKALDVEYMVFHVGHVTTKDAFLMKYNYSNKEVLKYTADLVNRIFEDSDIYLLFENLWWPGLTLTDQGELEYFMSLIDYKNKGVLLDLSHLLLTNPNIKDLQEGVAYIKQVVENLGPSKDWIKALHINSTEGYKYLKKDHKKRYQSYLEANNNERFTKIYEHISSMDEHEPFCHSELKDIIKLLEPKYMNIEVKSHDFKIWSDNIRKQKAYL